jgi:hypothetical protein
MNRIRHYLNHQAEARMLDNASRRLLDALTREQDHHELQFGDDVTDLAAGAKAIREVREAISRLQAMTREMQATESIAIETDQKLVLVPRELTAQLETPGPFILPIPTHAIVKASHAR